MSVVDDLKAARAEIVNRGRCTGHLYIDGKVCMMGAIGMATVDCFGEIVTHDDVLALAHLNAPESRALAVIAELSPHIHSRDKEERWPGQRLWAFNDDRTTTTEDVLMVFDKALAEHGAL